MDIFEGVPGDEGAIADRAEVLGVADFTTVRHAPIELPDRRSTVLAAHGS